MRRHSAARAIAIGLVLLSGLTWRLFAQSVADEHIGLVVVRVLEDSPAQRAGIVRGDILLEIDGTEVRHIEDIRRVLQDRKGGEKVAARIRHGDTTTIVEIRLEDRLYRPALGLEFASEQPTEPLLSFGVFGTDAALVMRVGEEGPAARAGIRPGDAIVSVGGVRIARENSLEELLARYRPGDTVVLGVIRAGQESEVRVQLGENDEGDAFLGVSYAGIGGRLLDRGFGDLLPRLRELFPGGREKPREDSGPGAGAIRNEII